MGCLESPYNKTLTQKIYRFQWYVGYTIGKPLGTKFRMDFSVKQNNFKLELSRSDRTIDYCRVGREASSIGGVTGSVFSLTPGHV